MSASAVDSKSSVASSLAAGVAWPVDAEAIRSRLSGRFVTRLPAITEHVWRRAEAEPAGSRLRRWLLNRVLIAGFAATDRRDWDLLGRFYSPDVVLLSGDGVPFDLPPVSYGWGHMRDELDRVMEVVVLDQKPREVIDLGGSFFAARIWSVMRGQASGIETTREFTCMYEVHDGKVMRQWWSAQADEIDGWLAERLAELGGRS